ncbi:MAG: site-specific integrase [Acidobacteria bacterium]|nr:site-specific integrase [Acidobacteriota bacterium]
MKGCSVFKTTAANGRVSWRYQAEIGRGADGRPIRISASGFKLQREASDALREKLKELRAGRPVTTTATLREYLDHWLPYHTKAKPLEPTTATRYVSLAAHAMQALGSVPLKDVSTFMLDDLYVKLAEKNLGPKTIREVHGVLHVALKRAVKTKLIPFNPADGCDLPRLDQKEAVVLNPEQLAAYQAAAAGSWIDLLIRLGAAIGARRGELLALRWADIDFTTNKVRIERSLYQAKGQVGIKPTKTRQARVVSIPLSLMEYLKLHREAQEQNRSLFGPDYRTDLDLIFGDIQGQFRKPDSVSWTACDIARRAGLKGVGLHALRHTHASTLLHAGVPVANVSKRLGHRDPYTTAKIYAHALPDTDQDVAATWDKIMTETAPAKFPAQICTNSGGQTTVTQ